MTTATKPKPPVAPAAPPQPSPAADVRDGVSVTPTFVAVLWLGCLLVGALGQLLPYTRPRPPAPPAPPVQARVLKVKLQEAPAPAPAPVPPPKPDFAPPPPLFAAAPPPPAAPPLAVALPSPAVAFALPVEAPARIVEVKQAAFVRPPAPKAPAAPAQTAPASPAPAALAAPSPGTGSGPASPGTTPGPAVQTLTFGLGEGNQPAPKYPEAARRSGQEGTVVIRLSVGPDGRVLAAEPSSPSPWGALNREALRVVRENWKFPPGSVRLYDVAIRFELTK